MNTIGDGKPAGIQSYSHAAVKQANHENQHKQQREPEHCKHKPDGMQLNKDNEVVSECEHCGQPLKAVKVDAAAMQKRGELYITKWREA